MMDAENACTTAQIIGALTPWFVALVTGPALAALLAYAKGMRTPRREEVALRVEHEALKEQVRASTPVPPSPEPAP